MKHLDLSGYAAALWALNQRSGCRLLRLIHHWSMWTGLLRILQPMMETREIWPGPNPSSPSLEPIIFPYKIHFSVCSRLMPGTLAANFVFHSLVPCDPIHIFLNHLECQSTEVLLVTYWCYMEDASNWGNKLDTVEHWLGGVLYQGAHDLPRTGSPFYVTMYLQKLSLTADLKVGSGFLDLLGFIISLNWQEILL